MKKMKKLLAGLVLGAVLCSTAVVAAPADTQTRAKILFELGLFKGYDDAGTNFGLADQATREQALVLLIRLLGEEKAALAWNGPVPYADVPADSWAKAYIGYAKEKGYTLGMGNNQFGTGRTVNMEEMTVFALRGLGYSDAPAVADFTYQNSLSFAKSKGILQSDTAISPFTRGNAVDILYGSINATVKGQSYALLTKLMNDGAVNQSQYDSAMAVSSGGTAIPDIKKLAGRFNTSMAHYNLLSAQLKQIGEEKQPQLASQLAEVLKALEPMAKDIETNNYGSGLSAATMAQYNSTLDAQDRVMNAMDATLAQLSQSTQGSSRKVNIKCVNTTGGDLQGLKIYVVGGSPSGSESLASGGFTMAQLEFSAGQGSYTVEFTDGQGKAFQQNFTIPAALKSGGTITLTFEQGAGGIGYTES